MRPSSSFAGRLALLLTPIAIWTSPTVARAIDYVPFCPSTRNPYPTTNECEVAVCVEADRTWEQRPVAYGTKCGPVDPRAMRKLGFCDGDGTCRNPERGRITPLYMILDVKYLPPGPASSVNSSRTSKIALTTSISNSFNVTAGVEFKVGYDIGFARAEGTTGITQSVTVGDTESMTIERETGSSFSMMNHLGYDNIDHRYDQIDFLMAPGIEYAAFPPGTVLPTIDPETGRPYEHPYNHVSWALDTSNAVHWWLPVGCLNGTLLCDPDEATYLETYFGIGPEEYPKILAATGYGGAVDFAGLWIPDPIRYEEAPVDYQEFKYAHDDNVDKGVSGHITDSSSVSQAHTFSMSTTVSLKTSTSGDIPVMYGMLTMGGTASLSFTWTHSTTVGASATDTTNEVFNVNMPGPDWPGPYSLAVYVDKLYQTFMFSHCSVSFAPPFCAAGPPRPAKPVGLTGAASPTQSSIYLSWTPIPGATGYTLSRSTSAAGPFAFVVVNFDGYSFQDTTATNKTTPYFYTVAALNKSGTGPDSDLAMVPAAPAGVTRTVSGSTVTVSWAPTSGATSYTVWRSASTYVGGFAKLAACTGISVTTCADTMPPAGTKYFYVVSASTPTGTSSWSSQVEVLSAPPAPTTVTATAGNASVSLSWGAVTGATSYDVQRSLYSSMAYPTTFTGITTAYKYDSGLVNGTTYYYRVRAVNPSGASAYSAIVSARPVAPPPPPPRDDGCPPYPQQCQ